MPRKVTFILTGSDRLNAKLRALTTQQAKAAIRSEARPALQPTLREARALCPVREGKLRRSIKVRAIRRSRTRVGMRVTTSKSDNAFSGKTFYGGFINWGWKVGKRRRVSLRRSRTDTSDTRKKIAGTNFMNRAARRTRYTALRIYSRGIVAYIRTITKK